jgi:hypothetical protein
MRLSWDPMAARDVRLESAAVWFQASTAWARPTSAACSASSGSTVRVAGPGPGPASSAVARTRGRSPPWPGSGPPTGADLPRCARSGRHSPDESGGRDRPVGCVGSDGSRQAVRGRHPAYCDWRRRRSVGRGRAAAPAAGTAVARWGPGSPRLGSPVRSCTWFAAPLSPWRTIREPSNQAARPMSCTPRMMAFAGVHEEFQSSSAAP